MNKTISFIMLLFCTASLFSFNTRKMKIKKIPKSEYKKALNGLERILFVKRNNYNANHYYTEFINGTWMPGGNISELNLKTGKVRDIVKGLDNGTFGRFDLSFDAKRIVFAWKKSWEKGYRIYEINIDGTGLRQLTFSRKNEKKLIKYYKIAGYHHATDDMHPCYLPDGKIIFISTRCEYGILCDAPDIFVTTTLFSMDKDGKNMEQLSRSSVSEAAPVVLNDGRVMYTRWEYVDKGAVSVKCLWAMNPDGTQSSEIYGNDISLPPTFIYGRPIPGAANKYVFLGTPHCPQTAVGTVIRLNMNKNIRTREPMEYLTPYVDIKKEPGFHFSQNGKRWKHDRSGRGPLFKEPYPLSEKHYLVSYKPPGPKWKDKSAYGIYLLNDKGSVKRIYKDETYSCFLPYPVKKRKVPPDKITALNPELKRKKLANCIVVDVYHGLENIKRGEVKFIRVLEQVPRPWKARRHWPYKAVDQQHAVISDNTHLGLKVLHGIVPVEEDGSANFFVPADKNIFFQVLDKDHLALQTERTFVNYRPGEVRSCVGCHETQNEVPLNKNKIPMALKRKPVFPGAQPGDDSPGRALSYINDVQPVLDKYCIKCHGEEKPKAGLNLSGKLTQFFNTSYMNLVRKGLAGKLIGENHPKTGNVHYLPAKSLGSYSSKLIKMLMKGHKNIKLRSEELLKISTWVDNNAQYYGTYWGMKEIKYRNHKTYFRPKLLFEEITSMEIPESLKKLHDISFKVDFDLYYPGASIFGSKGHKMLVVDHSKGGSMDERPYMSVINEKGKVLWDYPIKGNAHDGWQLPNGNFLIVYESKVEEISPDKKVVFQYVLPGKYVTACQRLPDGNTLIGYNPDCVLLEVTKEKKVVKKIDLSKYVKKGGKSMRLARKLENGNYLVAHNRNKSVREYSSEGELLKKFKVRGDPYACVRLKNGNTLVSLGSKRGLVELDIDGKIVWEVRNKHLPQGMRLHWSAGVQRLANGNTILVDWVDPKQFRGNLSTPQILEITPGKKVVWAFSWPEKLGKPNCVQILDKGEEALR